VGGKASRFSLSLLILFFILQQTMTPPRFQLAILLPTSLLLGLSNAEPITYSRGDKNAYLTARGEAVDSLDPLQNKTIRAQLLAQNNKSINHDDPITCTTYLAPSSIPNAGLGLYTSVSIPAETQLSSPQVGILLQDPDFHNPSRNDNNANTFNLLSNYVWSATPLTYGEHEVQHGESVCSGIGMMANCHYGLINVEIDSKWKNRPELDGTDSHSVMSSTHLTLEDVGRGSYSWHSNVQYKSLKGLEAGEEMFLSYGPQWYNNAEKEFGGYIPSKEHYEEADEMLTRFVEEFGKDNVVAYEKMIRYTQDKRLKTALPDRVEDVEKAIKVGTARFSAIDSIRTPDWLQENGRCLDNLVGGTSTIAQAGQGAFATKSITKGQVISTTPVVTLDREHLKLFKEIQRKDGTVRRKHVGHQLLLNYCYGHPKSSLIFFPTSPSVSFINHAADRSKANAEIKWSDFSYHKSEWINAPLAEIKKLQKTGLLFDIVATKEIERGDEILLYYGQEWEEKWTSHIANWESSQKYLTDTLDVDTIVDFNSIEKDEMIKTIDELEEEPLPEHIMTRCGFALPGDMKGDETVIKGYSAEDPIFVPCEFLDVEPLEGTDRYLYRAKVEHRSPQGDVTLYSVKYDSSQNFMRYTDKPYVRDYYSKGAFRNEIGLSEGILPAHWLDLK
jgi:hypothetical protein